MVVQKLRAKQLRKSSTDAERLLWRLLRARQLAGHKFRRQQPSGGFIVDFVCLEKRLVVEVDGGQHNEPQQAALDSQRSTWLEQQGFRVLRFWDHEVLKQIEDVKMQFGEHWRVQLRDDCPLGSFVGRNVATPHPDLLPQGRRKRYFSDSGEREPRLNKHLEIPSSPLMGEDRGEGD